MFDDPKKELERLEEQLLAAEEPDDEFERLYEEIFEEFGEKEQTTDEEYLKGLLTEEPPVRNHANGYGTKTQSAPQIRSVPPQGTRSAAPANRSTYSDPASRSVPAPKKEKSTRGLKIAICLECLGIVAVVAWWLIRLM